MKKKFLLFTALFVFILNVSAQESIVKDVFEQFVADKIEKMQELINPNYSSLSKMSLIDQFFMPYRFFFNNFINHELLWSY